MSLITGLLALLALPGRSHTSSVGEKINAAENDALDLAALLIDAKAELTQTQAALAHAIDRQALLERQRSEMGDYVAEANRQRDHALNALTQDRDLTIALRRECADLTSQRDYAFARCREAREYALEMQMQNDNLLRDRAELRARYGDDAVVDATLTPRNQTSEQMRAQIPYPAPSDGMLEQLRAQADLLQAHVQSRFAETALMSPVMTITPTDAQAMQAELRAQSLREVNGFTDPGHSHAFQVPPGGAAEIGNDIPAVIGPDGIARLPEATPGHSLMWGFCTCTPARHDLLTRPYRRG